VLRSSRLILASEYYIRMDVINSEKHASLFQYEKNYDRKMFYSIQLVVLFYSYIIFGDKGRSLPL
jgi:hypothetical protein